MLQNLVPQIIFFIHQYLMNWYPEILRWQMHTTYYIKDLHSYFEAPSNIHNEWRRSFCIYYKCGKTSKEGPSSAGTCNWWYRAHDSAAFAFTSPLEDSHICSYVHGYVLRHTNCGKAECIEDTTLKSLGNIGIKLLWNNIYYYVFCNQCWEATHL